VSRHGVGRDSIPPGAPQSTGQTLAAAALGQVDELTAADLFVGLTTRTLAYHARGRYDEAKAREVFAALRRFLGYGTTWWTNTDQTGWNPVTRHIIDAIVIGTGKAITVVLLAFDED
jgi:hypothetical protein